MSMVVAGCIGAAGSIVSGIIGMGASKSAARAAAREKARLQKQKPKAKLEAITLQVRARC